MESTVVIYEMMMRRWQSWRRSKVDEAVLSRDECVSSLKAAESSKDQLVVAMAIGWVENVFWSTIKT
jgi:hypothetical protein